MLKRQKEVARATEPHHGGNAADLDWVRRIAQGDVRGVGHLYDRHAAAMYSLALRILDREAVAKDVVQEVFAQVWREAGRDEASRGIVGAWLLMLTRNRAVDRLRALRVGTDVPGTADGDAWRQPASANDEPSFATPGFDASERVRAAFRALPDPQRIAIEMTYFEGLSQHEIARRLELPLDTVNTRIRLALLKLRTAATREVR